MFDVRAAFAGDEGACGLSGVIRRRPGANQVRDLLGGDGAFRRIADQTDEGWVNRAWNDTTNTVITGKALMQIHGDWMKGEWLGAGKVAGTCL